MTSDAFSSMPCADCEAPLQRGIPEDLDYPADGPLRQPTPLLRMTALVQKEGIVVTDLAAASTGRLAGAIALAVDERQQLRAVVGLADDLDEDLRTDLLAFALALFVGDPNRLADQPDARLGLGRKRLPSARGVGHLAFHMVYGCGRDTPSATFELVPL